MKKQLLPILTTVFVLVIVICSCNKSEKIATLGQQRTLAIADKVKDQLKLSQENIAAKQLPLKMLSYEFESAISTDEQVTAVKKQLIKGTDVVPQFNGFDVSTFAVSTINERMTAYAKENNTEQNVVENIQQSVLPQIKKGQRVMDILWEANGKQFHSKCIYSDEGVVYDHMLSNISFVESPTSDERVLLSPNNSIKINDPASSSVAARYSFTSTVRNITIKWVWGGTRGKIIIKHYIIRNGINYIYDHGGSTDAWMSAGSASARRANNYLNRRALSKMAWAYGWATPTASFSIKFNSSNLTFSTSTSGIGSKGSGSGIHTIYL